MSAGNQKGPLTFRVDFYRRDLYFQSKITLGRTITIIFICTIPLFLNCLEADKGYRNVKSYLLSVVRRHEKVFFRLVGWSMLDCAM